MLLAQRLRRIVGDMIVDTRRFILRIHGQEVGLTTDSSFKWIPKQFDDFDGYLDEMVSYMENILTGSMYYYKSKILLDNFLSFILLNII